MKKWIAIFLIAWTVLSFGAGFVTAWYVIDEMKWEVKGEKI